MQSRLTMIAAGACLVGILGLTILQPPTTSAVSEPLLNTPERFIQLLEIRGRRELTPGEEREMRELRLQMIQSIHDHSRRPARDRWQ